MHLTPGNQEVLSHPVSLLAVWNRCSVVANEDSGWRAPPFCSWDPTVTTSGAASGFSVSWGFFLSVCTAVRSLHLEQTFLSIWAVGNLVLRSLQECLPRGWLTKSHGGLLRSFRVHLRDSAQSLRSDCSSQCLSWMCFAHLILPPFFRRWF